MGPVEKNREGGGGYGDDQGSAGSSGLGHRGAIESVDYSLSLPLLLLHTTAQP